MELLVSSAEHAFSMPTVCRATVSAEIFKRFIAPVAVALVQLEENATSPTDSSSSSNPAADPEPKNIVPKVQQNTFPS